MFFTSKVVATLSLLTVTLAKPILSAHSCKPNFQGNPITIYQPIPGNSDVYEWTPVNANGGHITLIQEWEWRAFGSGEFLVLFTGQPDSSYLNFKYAITSSLAFHNSHVLITSFLLLGWLLILSMPLAQGANTRGTSGLAAASC
jgi:hypothetical protein